MNTKYFIYMQPRRKEFTQHTVLQFQLFSGACCFRVSSTRNPLNQNFIERNNILQLPFSPSLSSSPYHCSYTFCTLPPLSLPSSYYSALWLCLSPISASLLTASPISPRCADIIPLPPVCHS